MSGIRENDKIMPVITIVLYWGDKKWDGVRSLYDMFDVKGNILKCIHDYYIDLIASIEIDDFGNNQCEVH